MFGNQPSQSSLATKMIDWWLLEQTLPLGTNAHFNVRHTLNVCFWIVVLRQAEHQIPAVDSILGWWMRACWWPPSRCNDHVQNSKDQGEQRPACSHGLRSMLEQDVQENGNNVYKAVWRVRPCSLQFDGNMFPRSVHWFILFPAHCAIQSAPFFHWLRSTQLPVGC